MNDMTQVIFESIQKQLNLKGLEIASIIPIPPHSDPMVRLGTLQELLDHSIESGNKDSVELLLRIRPSSGGQTLARKDDLPQSNTPEDVYLHSGKLNIPFLLRTGDILFDAGDFPLSRNIFSVILKSGEITSTALHRLGKCFEAEGNPSEAIANFEASIAYHPSLEVYKQLAALLTTQGRHNLSADVFERALNLKDLQQEVRVELHKAAGNSWARAHRPNNAEKHYKTALELHPSGDDIRSNMGVLFLQCRKPGEARRHFLDAIASNPRNALALAGVGSCFLFENDKKSALEYFSQSLEIEVNNLTALLHLVQCAYELKTYATAVLHVKNYLKVSPSNPSVLYSLAGLQFHMGRLQEAEPNARRVLALQPQHEGAKELLGLIERYSPKYNHSLVGSKNEGPSL